MNTDNVLRIGKNLLGAINNTEASNIKATNTKAINIEISNNIYLRNVSTT